MSNPTSTLQTSLLFGALSMLPGNTFPYIALGLASASLGAYAVQHYSPSQRLLRLEHAITATEEILAGAKLNCARDHMTLIERGGLLLEAKLSASEIQTKILEPRDKTREEYFQAFKEIMEDISKCTKDVKEIQTATLLTIEAERQRKLSEGIKDSEDVFNAVVRSPTRHAQLPSRRSDAGRASFLQGSSMIDITYSLPWWWYGWDFGKVVESIGIVASYRGGAYALQMSSIANQRAHFMGHGYRGTSAPTVKRDMRYTPA
ncbi:hypothetical protein B0H17DRAFT_1127096 [Mycena rosella]|uniref:Uncharacterized protein n=1 Tax=Mycena rosella TaxID=1033263 RepID=A0AAD7M713_MYCRO|nr:hypothetical protein B0H17DRAFT_1127096 [Mycena rosella]